MIALLTALLVSAVDDYRHIVTVFGPGAILAIQEGQFHCPDGARRAMLVSGSDAYIGCAKKGSGGWVIIFEDGDVWLLDNEERVHKLRGS